MTLHAANPIAPFWFTPAAAGEDGPRFQLRGLTPLQLFDVHAGAEVADGQVKWTARAVRTAMRAGFLGWERFTDANDQPVEFSGNVDANIERLGFFLTTEIFMAILNASSLSEADRKN